MPALEAFADICLMLLSYAYILCIILFSSRAPGLLGVSQRASRRFLHAMIGNLPFVIPFFTSSIYPVLVASPFIAVTFLASPYSPFESVLGRLKGLRDITEEGHHLGLILYAASYTILALFFGTRPTVFASGILPMAHGDTAASIVGVRYGRNRYSFAARKSLEGSAAMFAASFLSLTLGLLFFSALYAFPLYQKIPCALGVAVVATFAEALTPRGFDNLTVPLLGAMAFLLLEGGP